MRYAGKSYGGKLTINSNVNKPLNNGELSSVPISINTRTRRSVHPCLKIAKPPRMGHSLHTWTWASALTGVYFLFTGNAAPTSSVLSLFQPSNFLGRFPCIPALSNSSKPAKFPISSFCTEPTNETLQNDRADGFWAWPPFALFCMEDYPPQVHTPALPTDCPKSSTNPPDH